MNREILEVENETISIVFKYNNQLQLPKPEKLQAIRRALGRALSKVEHILKEKSI